jgi:hypothetical protein
MARILCRKEKAVMLVGKRQPFTGLDSRIAVYRVVNGHGE